MITSGRLCGRFPADASAPCFCAAARLGSRLARRCGPCCPSCCKPACPWPPTPRAWRARRPLAWRFAFPAPRRWRGPSAGCWAWASPRRSRGRRLSGAGSTRGTAGRRGGWASCCRGCGGKTCWSTRSWESPSSRCVMMGVGVGVRSSKGAGAPGRAAAVAGRGSFSQRKPGSEPCGSPKDAGSSFRSGLPAPPPPTCGTLAHSSCIPLERLPYHPTPGRPPPPPPPRRRWAGASAA